MKKIISLLVLCLLVVMGAQAQLLWKISGNGLAKPSYVIGTYHLAPVSFADSIPGLKEALDASEQVYGELDMNELNDMNKVMQLQQAMMLPEGQSLDKLLTAEQLTRLNAYLTKVMGVDFSNPMVAAQLGKLSPVALEQQLSLLNCMKKRPGFDPQNLFDGYFQKVAVEQGKPVGGLETVDFQVKTLFSGKPLERQVVSLMCLVDHSDYYDTVVDDMITGFFSQDLARLQKVIEQKRGDACDSSPEEDDALLYARNKHWAAQLPVIMKEKSTFLAVGAGHLPGDRGLLALLRAAGYEVTAVK